MVNAQTLVHIRLVHIILGVIVKITFLEKHVNSQTAAENTTGTKVSLWKKNNGKKQQEYSKVSIMRPGCSRLLEFENKIVLVVFQISRPGRLIEPKNWLWQPWNKTVQSIFSEMDLVV